MIDFLLDRLLFYDHEILMHDIGFHAVSIYSKCHILIGRANKEGARNFQIIA